MTEQAEWDFLAPEEKIRWAWLAGIIDGEGGIWIDSPRMGIAYDSLRLVVEMGDRRTIQELKRISNVGRIYETPPSGRRKRSFRWETAGRQAASVLRTCLPVLVTKKAEAEIALAFALRQSLYITGKSVPPYERERRRALSEALKILHSKGRRPPQSNDSL